jgi:serine phosphatase RsbU (regulator of sigma subunit)
MAPLSATTSAAVPSVTADADTLAMVCAEVWGGNRTVDHPVRMPGLRGHLFSRPLGGSRGGDVHHLAVCNSGLIARVCIADVVGHGDQVSAVSDELHDLLRRYLDTFDQRVILRRLNRRLSDGGFGKLTTAAALTYFAPTRWLSVSYAGHPPGWYYSAATGRWERLTIPAAPVRAGTYIDVPLAVDPDSRFSRHNRRVALGDRVLLVTDGLIEGRTPAGEQFGAQRVTDSLNDARTAPIDVIADSLLTALNRYAEGQPAEDDITLLALEFVPGPTMVGSLWHAFRSRLTKPHGHVPANLATG